MRGFNLPITIESRKIIYLDLQENSNFNEDDIFIVSAPENSQKRTIVAISKEKTLQSILENEDDISISNLKFNVIIRSKNSILIDLNHNQSCPINYNNHNNELDLETIETKEDFRINVKGAQELNSLPVVITFQYLCKNEKIYTRDIKIYVINKSDIYYSGLDFGSEASQIIEGKYKFNNIQYNFVDLFDNIKKSAEATLKKIPNKEFEQFENEAGHKLFKSIFYTKKTINVTEINRTFRNSLKILTTNDKEDIAKFNKEFQQIPNLKLIHNNTFAESIKFNITYPGVSQKQSISLNAVHEDVYAELLDEMLTAFLKNQVINPVFVRFTVLVPNIYSIDEILNTKNIIRRVFNQYHLVSRNILGLEITSISESDAAFLGCYGYLKQENSESYYLCIDCGKGTTDFSIINSKGSGEFVPIYRNGFAGAGNLISYAIFESIKSFFYNELDLNMQAKNNLEKFLDKNLIMGGYFIKELYRYIEIFKKNQTNNLSYAQINDHWKNAKSDDLTFEKLFSNNQVDIGDFLAVLAEVKYINDWGNYIDDAIIDIVLEIEKNITKVVDNLSNKHSKINFSGVLMTGRGFLFKPLSDCLTTNLSNNKYFKNTIYINNTNNNIDLKEICLQGIFTPNIKIYNDLVNTPIEINNNNFEQIEKSGNLFISSSINLIKRFFNWDIFFGTEYYDLESNSLNIIQTDLSNNIRFLIGGKIFVPDKTFLLSPVTKLVSAKVICTRDGFYFIGDNQGSRIILPLIQSLNSINPPAIQDRVQKSLFPVYYNNKI